MSNAVNQTFPSFFPADVVPQNTVWQNRTHGYCADSEQDVETRASCGHDVWCKSALPPSPSSVVVS